MSRVGTCGREVRLLPTPLWTPDEGKEAALRYQVTRIETIEAKGDQRRTRIVLEVDSEIAPALLHVLLGDPPHDAASADETQLDVEDWYEARARAQTS